jgi:hypothetical protein
VADWSIGDGFCCVTRTAEELSLVCEESRIPVDVPSERGWAALKLEGPFPFSMTGVLASFLDPLAASRIPIFAVSTFDTDYVLVKREDLDTAMQVLAVAGHSLVSDTRP